MKRVDIISKVVGRDGQGKPVGGGISIPMGNYALKSDFESLKSMFNDFLEGDDTDSVINRWKDLEAFLNGISEDNTLDSILKAYVTLSGTQTITGEKNFTGGLKVNGSPLVYNKESGYWKLEGDLLVTGSVSMFSSDTEFTPSTIMDAIVVDNVTIIKQDGKLVAIGGGGTGGGGVADAIAWGNVLGKPAWITDSAPSINVSGVNVSLGGSITQSALRTALGLGSNAYSSTAYLPLTGGTLSGTSAYTLTIKRTGDKPLIAFNQGDDLCGFLGITNQSQPVFIDNNGSIKYIIHSDNIGSYNAGSATKLQTARTIWGHSFDGTSNIDGSIVMTNDSSIAIKTSSGTSIPLLHFPASHNFHLGYGAATNGFNTYIDGKNIYLRYGTSHTTGITLDSDGNVTLGRHLHFLYDRALYWQNKDNVLVNGLYMNGNGNFIIGYGIPEYGNGTYIDGKDVTLRYGTSHTTGLLLNSSGNITIGSSDLASTNCKLYVDGYTQIKSASTPLRLVTTNTASYAPFLDAYHSSLTSGQYYLMNFGLTASKNNSAWMGFYYSGSASTSNRISFGFTGNDNLFNIAASGNIGLGLASPLVKCHINGTTRIQRVNDASTYLDILCQDISVRYMGYDSEGWVDHIFYSNDSELMRISGSTKRLTVQGNILATGGVTTNDSMTINGIKLYKSQDGVLYLDGNLVVRGGVTMYGSDSESAPSILDSLPIASTTAKGIAQFSSAHFTVTDGIVSIIGSNVGLNQTELESYLTTNKYAKKSDIPTIPTSLKNPYSLTFGSKTYDGSAARTIAASDLGALTSHQTIHALTIKNSAGTTQLTYTPNSATGSLTLTKAMVGLGNVENTALSTWTGSNNLTTLGTITTGTWNGTKIANTYLANSAITISGTSVSLGGSITQSALRTALGLGSNAYSSTAFLPLTGGTLSGTSAETLRIDRTNEGTAYVSFRNNEVVRGYLGVNPSGEPVFANKGGTAFKIWHEGNFTPSNYVPLTGGVTMTGILNIATSGTPLSIRQKNGGTSYINFRSEINGTNTDLGDLGVDTSHNLVYYKGGWKKVWHEGNFTPSNYLPLSGGTLSGSTAYTLTIKRTGDKPLIAFNQGDDLCGFLGITNQSQPVFIDNNGSIKYIIHSDNIGSYNAGSATKLQTARTIWGHSFDGTSNIDGSIVMTNDSSIAIKTSSGTSIPLLHFPASHNFHLGYGAATNGFNTYIDGKNIYLRYGTSHTTGITLDSDGNVTLGRHLHFLYDRALYWQNKDNVLVNGLYMNGNGNFIIGYGIPEYGNGTYIDGKDVTLRYGTSHTTGLLLNSSGNITIGSSDLASTNCKLYVDGYTQIKSASTPLRLVTTNTASYAPFLDAYHSSLTSGQYYLMNFGLTASKNNSAWMGFYYSGSASTSNRISFGFTGNDNLFNIAASGNIGLGLASPLVKCHINGTTRIQRVNDASTYLDILCQDISVRYMGYDSEGWVDHIFYSNDSELMRISGSTKRLTVQGNILATGGVTMQSARKLKNIQDERGLSLEELKIIKPTRFTWKDNRDEKIHIGGIADDVMKVLPEVIYKTDDDTLTMDYGNAAFAIAASLIKPVINHEQRIKVLEEENEQLKREIEQLKWNIA